ncbi:RNA methyltransferase [Sporosarcina sp. FSL W7-1349]|uniref:TrmH family RNA methyltransferase n=1 Tax=Sporosarcina sp. FSL W7-1349 TaxID=2921561 RepID=UPI0030FB7BCC
MKRIESTQNSLVKYWKKLVTTRKERDKSGEFLVEGFHLAEEALRKEGTVLHLIVREDVELPASWDVNQIQLIEITKAVANEIAETEQSQGVYAHCRQPEVRMDEKDAWDKFLFVDAVQDPGNIGTILRTADAAGIDAVILGKGAADPYNPKTVRSAQGSHFHIPIIREDLHDWISYAKNRGIPVIGTGLENANEHYQLGALPAFCLLVGNEGSGVNPEFLKEADEIVKIPLYGQAESLNVAVATGILLYTVGRR